MTKTTVSARIQMHFVFIESRAIRLAVYVFSSGTSITQRLKPSAISHYMVIAAAIMRSIAHQIDDPGMPRR